jgi:murein DD-endopeptidase MepM/ murein hydrolase activator NlpD
MNPYTSSACIMLAALLAPILFLSVPSVGYAATFSSNYQSGYSSEGRSSYSRERYSSSVSKKIRALDEDIVEDLPIPVLFLSLKKIYPDFGDPRDGGARTHEGQDILAPRGSFIVSPTDAVVTRTGEGSSEGIYVYTANPGGETFRYMHLDHVADGIKTGTVLKPGDLIGYVGNTGNAAGGPTHLHFEVREGRTALDPYPRLTGSFTQEQLIDSLTHIIAILTKELRSK